MNVDPIFSVIVPTCHRNDLLTKCLDRLAPDAQTLMADQYEVIVTDDGVQTTAEEVLRARYSWARWVPGARKGPAANRNNGSQYARGQWLVFCDDDCIPDTQWLEAYANAISANPSCLIFEGRVYVDRPRRSLAEAAPIFETGGYLPSGNFVCRKDVFKSLNGFDERFPYAAMEDVELRLRLTKAGYKFSFIREAAVCHPWRSRGGWKELKRHQASTFIYLSIHPSETSRLNASYYLSAFLRNFLQSTIPNGLKYKGSGLKHALLENVSSLQMAFLLFTKLGKRRESYNCEARSRN
jgi:GT2 family glycosyltransferase